MISSCPHCQNTLKLGDSQKAKLQKALDALAPGKKLTIKCPACQQPIALESGAAVQGSAGGLKPPGPPDLSWMKEDSLQDEDKLEDVPMALILFPDNKQREIMRDAIEAVGYQVVFAANIEDAHERMRFVNFACVIQYSQFDGPSLENSDFHKYMREMAMSRHRPHAKVTFLTSIYKPVQCYRKYQDLRLDSLNSLRIPRTGYWINPIPVIG